MTYNVYRKEKCNVLVVGGGGAGLRAAIEAGEELSGVSGRVILATKGKLGKSGVTAVACSDRMAFHATLPHTQPGTDDSWVYHARDIYEIGGRVSDAPLARILAKNSADAYQYLEDIGVPFVRKGRLPHQFVTDGSEFARACYTGPKTAVHIEEKLVERFRDTAVETIDDCSVFRLLTKEDGRICGALALVKTAGGEEQLVVFETPAVIMATGGGGEIFADNVFPPGNSGDGFAAAYLAGAELVNMEFIQIGIASVATKLNCSGSLMRAIPRVVNDAGEEFLPRYFPPGTPVAEICNLMFKKGATWPVSYEHKTHIFDIAFFKERQAGRKVYLDYMNNPSGFDFSMLDPVLKDRYREEMKLDLGEDMRKRSPAGRLKEINSDSIEWLKERGINPVKGNKIEAATCIQHFQGGIKINARGEATVRGLYAAGECAGGQHGANRPGGNALLDGQVFGKICGREAARYAMEEPETVIDTDGIDSGEFAEPAGPDGSGGEGIPAGEARQELQGLMGRTASVVRTAEGLKQGLEELLGLSDRGVARDHHGDAFAVETRAMFPVAEAVLRAALERDESRGPHLRFHRYEDNEPQARRDPEWQNYIVIRRTPNGTMELSRRQPTQ